MFVVIFEVEPKRERWDDYLDLAKGLRPELERIDGFIDNERFKSARNAARLLSLSTWRDEKAVVRWRSHGEHHGVQEKGRFEIFADYRIRVGEVTGDSAAAQGERLAQQRFDETETGEAKAVTVAEIGAGTGGKPACTELATALGAPENGTAGALGHETFESIYHPGKLLLLAAWRDQEAAQRWRPQPVAGAALRHRAVRVIRDYGMFERGEAPQYYPGVARR